ncbi:hypothetical protein [Nostoc sp.]|uniref:hypothetical protein n=1 Tax=Nostoc sp. TaxID=1180 RepID=UPI002FFA87AC
MKISYIYLLNILPIILRNSGHSPAFSGGKGGLIINIPYLYFSKLLQLIDERYLLVLGTLDLPADLTGRG